MKKIFLILSMAILTSVIHFENAQAGSGSDVGGGGEIIDINSRPALRDLVDSTTCLWVNAKVFSDKLPYFSKILKSIDDVHWLFALQLEFELNRLRICSTTAPLRKIPTEDISAVTIYSVKTDQVGIRINNMIFISKILFDKMTDEDKAFLILHEVMHSYIPMNVVRRNTKLRSFVAAIHEHVNKPLTPDEFAIQMEMNDLTPNKSSKEIEPLKNSARIVLNPTSTDAEYGPAAQNIQEWLDQDPEEQNKKQIWNHTFNIENNDINSWDKFQKRLAKFQKPLFDAINENNLAELEIARDAGISPNARIAIDFNNGNNYYQTALYKAVSTDKIESVNFLLAQPKINPNILSEFLKAPEGFSYKDILSMETPLHIAVKNGSIKSVLALFANPKTDLNIKDNLKLTPLHYAIDRKSPDSFNKMDPNMIALFLNNLKVNVNTVSKDGETPFLMFVKKCSFSDANIELSPDRVTSFDYLTILNLFIKNHRVDLNWKDNDLTSALSYSKNMKDELEETTIGKIYEKTDLNTIYKRLKFPACQQVYDKIINRNSVENGK